MKYYKFFIAIQYIFFTTQFAIAQLPDPGFVIDHSIAIVNTDPQNDLLSLRELLEDGYEVAVVGDATASAIITELDGNKAAQTNFRFIASHVYTTTEVTEAIRKASVKTKLLK